MSKYKQQHDQKVALKGDRIQDSSDFDMFLKMDSCHSHLAAWQNQDLETHCRKQNILLEEKGFIPIFLQAPFSDSLFLSSLHSMMLSFLLFASPKKLLLRGDSKEDFLHCSFNLITSQGTIALFHRKFSINMLEV